jgi:hypothetical protein
MIKTKLLILNAIVFLMCGAMSKCREMPGPITTIHGYVTDTVTGQPIANLQMEVVSVYASNFESDIHLTTGSDGSFYLKFTPPGTEAFFLRPVQSEIMRYFFLSYTKIVLGKDNTFNLKTFQNVTLNIRLIKNPAQKHTNYSLNITPSVVKVPGYGTLFEFQLPKADTTLTTWLPQNADYIFKSDFFNGYSATGFIDSVNFYKTIKLGVVDTTVVITNP